MDKPIKFTFRFISEKGMPGFLSKRGRFDGDGLTLGKDYIAPHEIHGVALANGRLALHVFRDGGSEEQLVLANIPGRRAKQLRHELIVASSTHRAAMHQDEQCSISSGWARDG